MTDRTYRCVLCPDSPQPQPLDVCAAAISRDELREVHKLHTRRVFRPTVWLALVSVAVFACALIFDMGLFVIGMSFGYGFIVVTIALSNRSSLRRSHRRALADHGGEVDIFEFYEDCFYYTLRKNGETVRISRIDYSRLGKTRREGAFLTLPTDKDIFYLPLRCLSKDSPVLTRLLNAPEMKLRERRSRLTGAVSLALVWACAVLMIVVSRIPNAFSPDKPAALLLCLLIPLASFVFGLVMAVKGRGCIINIIAGVLSVIIIVIIAIIPNLDFPQPEYAAEPGDKYVLRAEELMDLDFMTYASAETSSYGEGTDQVRYTYISYTEEQWGSISRLLTDGRWTRELPTALNSIASAYGGAPYYDYILIYNVDTGQYNSLPDEDGLYQFVTVIYNSEWKGVEIEEYYIDYIALKEPSHDPQ